LLSKGFAARGSMPNRSKGYADLVLALKERLVSGEKTKPILVFVDLEKADVELAKLFYTELVRAKLGKSKLIAIGGGEVWLKGDEECRHNPQ
jgi:hypothetical protein